MICQICKEKMYCYGGDNINMLYTHTKKQNCGNKILIPRKKKYSMRRAK